MFADESFAVPLINQRIAVARPVMEALLKANYARLDRSQQPRSVEYQLVWKPGWTSDPNAWNVWTSASHFTHFDLVPIHQPG